MEYLCYGLGDFSFCFIYGAIGSYIVFFYTDVACISAATVGTVLLVSKIFDGISDMMMGYIIENVHSPLGKARPWLLWMVIPYCIGCVLLFTVPDFSETGKVIYAFISYNLMATCIFTSMNVPYGVLSSVMTNKQNERALLSISRASLGALGVFVISSYAACWFRCYGTENRKEIFLIFITGSEDPVCKQILVHHADGQHFLYCNDQSLRHEHVFCKICYAGRRLQ